MLFTEQDFYTTNAMDMLNEATYLSEDESLINPKTIPVKEVSRIGYGVVRFDDVDKLSESYGIDYIDAMYMIAESSDMNPEYLAVSVPEEDIIAYPEIVNELANIVIQPLSEYDPVYQFVTECVNAYTESGDEDYLGLLLEEENDSDTKSTTTESNPKKPGLLARIKSKFKRKKVEEDPESLGYGIKQKVKGTLSDLKDTITFKKKREESSRKMRDKIINKLNLPLTPSYEKEVKDEFGDIEIHALKLNNKTPKSFVAKKIASLRRLYRKFMVRYHNTNESGIKVKIKHILAKILTYIDKLLAWMQRKTDSSPKQSK